MKDFFINHWKELVVIFCFLVEFVLSIVVIFKKAKKGSTLYTDILSFLPTIISKVEMKIGKGKGIEKMRIVLDSIDKIFVKETGKVMTTSETKFFKNAIEDILDTPQKKKET